MNVVVLHVLSAEVSTDYGELRLARPALAPDEWVLLWEGLAPGPAPEHPSLAPVRFRGDLSGRAAYAEAVPRGLRWSAAALPTHLRPYAVCRVLEALVALHEAHQVHGAVGPDRVWLGGGGEVVLVGRGRSAAMARLDVLGAMALLSGTEDTLPSEDPRGLLEELGERCRAGDRDALGAWVREQVTAPAAPLEQVLVTLADPPDHGADEVLPDLGSDTGGDGLLDRWVATTGGITPGETTSEVTDAGATSHHTALALWSRLASLPAGHPSRFDAVAGQPSRGIRRVLQREPPEPLPVLPAGSPGLTLPTSDTPAPESEDTQVMPVQTSPWSTAQIVMATAALAAIVWAALWLFSRL